MRGDVRVAVHVGREGGGRVHDVEGHGVVDPWRPGAGSVRFDDRVSRGVVPRYVVREAGEVGGELGFVGGSRGHGAGLGCRCRVEWGWFEASTMVSCLFGVIFICGVLDS